MSQSLRINTTYEHTRVGTGTYTRNLVAALPEAKGWAIPPTLLRHRAMSFWLKRGIEELSSLTPGLLIHPYWATTNTRRAVIAALDLVQYREGTSAERNMLRRAARRARAVLALSSWAADELLDSLGRSCVLAPPFPETGWYVPQSVTPVPPSGRIRLAYWGGWHPRKRAVDFLRSLAQTRWAPDLEVVCTGTPPDIEGLSVRSCGTPTVEDLVRLVDNCHASFYPSEEEGFGLPVFESLLRGVPVVARPLRVYREFTLESRAKVALESNDPDCVADAVTAALDAGRQSPSELLCRPTLAESRELLRGALLTAVADDCAV